MTEVLEQEVATEATPVIAADFKDWSSEPATIAEQEVTEEVVAEPIVEETKPEEAAPITETPIVETKQEVFANQESENIYNLIKDGKLEEVTNFLNEKKKLDTLEVLTPIEQIRTSLEYKHKDYTKEEIQDILDEKFNIPTKPEQGYDQTDEEYQEAVEKYESQLKKVETKISREAKDAVADLEKLKLEIQLPTFGNNEPTQEELEMAQKEANEFTQSVKKLTSEFNGYTTVFKDEEVEIPVQYNLTDKQKDEVAEIAALSATDAKGLFAKIGWLKEDGSINSSKLIEDLPFLLNKNSILENLVSEIGNKRHEASVKGIKNISFSEKRSGSPDKSEAQAKQGFVGAFLDI